MKKVVGIISIILFAIIEFQSCAAGLGNAMTKNKEVSGSAGLILGVFMLIGGILALASKHSKGIVITSIIFFALGGIVGYANVGHFKDLTIWSGLSLAFAVLLGAHLGMNSEDYKKKK
ncbi:hypothetical protein [Clostridium sp. HBUAS56017]|uniref:hypothetical protein n=1 Tax=Clostridium sp. HBUAS56017 TaxID=2571128 RepID=UPI001177C6D2|nr:hypothetical protein [Clostridium sp. HBUAS56017]